MYVKDLDLVVTVQVLKDTPTVLSLGRLCEDHGYSHEWIGDQRPQKIKNGRKFPHNTENFVPIVVRGFSSGFSNTSAAQPSSTSFITGVNARIFYAENSKKTKTGPETGSRRLGADS